MDINVGIGDHVFLRVFLDGVKNNYDNIYITHSKPGMQFWHNNDPNRWNFNLQLASLMFNEKPYSLVINPKFYFPFYPHERIIKELNNKPVKPNLDCLCVGKSLGIEKYIVITTKARQFPKIIFEQCKEKLTNTLQELSKKYKIVILGEREVERSKEYEAECNRDQVFGLYDYLISVLKPEDIIDLTIPALGITPSNLTQFQQDCLIMKEASAVVTFGIGGNLWMSVAVAKKTISLRVDNEWATDLLAGYPNMLLTKDLNQFCENLLNF
jgi:hypothetical protein